MPVRACANESQNDSESVIAGFANCRSGGNGFNGSVRAQPRSQAGLERPSNAASGSSDTGSARGEFEGTTKAAGRQEQCLGVGSGPSRVGWYAQEKSPQGLTVLILRQRIESGRAHRWANSLAKPPAGMNSPNLCPDSTCAVTQTHTQASPRGVTRN